MDFNQYTFAREQILKVAELEEECAMKTKLMQSIADNVLNHDIKTLQKKAAIFAHDWKNHNENIELEKTRVEELEDKNKKLAELCEELLKGTWVSESAEYIDHLEDRLQSIKSGCCNGNATRKLSESIESEQEK